MKPAKPVPAPLTKEQILVAKYFALMDDRRQLEVMRYVVSIAKAFPRRARPVLRIVGGAK